MALFAIADLHFAFSVDKPMDIFGENWKNHSEKIIASWKEHITEEDTVLLPGDLSWGMRIDEAAADLDVIYSLLGRKILLGGNHDYWWKTSSKLEARYPGMRFLKNNFDRYEDWHICGTRGWLCRMMCSLRSRIKRFMKGSRCGSGCLWMPPCAMVRKKSY